MDLEARVHQEALVVLVVLAVQEVLADLAVLADFAAALVVMAVLAVMAGHQLPGPITAAGAVVVVVADLAELAGAAVLLVVVPEVRETVFSGVLVVAPHSKLPPVHLAPTLAVLHLLKHLQDL